MLRYKAPKSTLTPDLLAAMCQQKAELYDLVEEWSERVAMAELKRHLTGTGSSATHATRVANGPPPANTKPYCFV